MHADGAIDDVAIEFRPARHDGKIFLLDGAVLELRGQLEVGAIGAGHEDNAAGIAVEAMDDARAGGTAAAAQGGAEVELQGPGQGPRPMSPRRMDHHAGRLVDDHQLVVLVEDVQGDVFRSGRLAGDFRQHDADALAGAEAEGRLAAAAVDRRAAGGDDAAEVPAAVGGEVHGQEDVQPQLGFGLADDQFDGLVGELSFRGGGFCHAAPWRVISSARLATIWRAKELWARSACPSSRRCPPADP